VLPLDESQHGVHSEIVCFTSNEVVPLYVALAMGKLLEPAQVPGVVPMSLLEG
jgi:hypothetical protein